MTTQAQRTANLQQGRLEADLAAGVSALFRRCPTLCGFSVRDAASLAREGFALDQMSEIFVSEVSVFPFSGLDAPGDICREIAHALVRLLDERPEARELLRERTFARAFH